MLTIKRPALMSLAAIAFISCSKSSDNSTHAPLSPDTAILACSTPSESSLSQSNCPHYSETSLPSSFFSESRKIIPFKNGYLVLRSVSDPELLNLKTFSKIEDSIKNERGTIAFIEDRKIAWELKDKSLNIFDFDVSSKNQIIAIAQNELEPGNIAKFIWIDSFGNATIKAFTDISQNDDPCINNISAYTDSLCLSAEDNKYAPLVTFQVSSPYVYEQAKIKWSRTPGQFYVAIDRGQKEITSLYKMKTSISGEVAPLWKQPLILGTLTAFEPQLLSSGEERIGLNRFGRFFEKQLLVDQNDDVYVGFNGLLSLKAVLLSHMSVQENKDFIQKNGALSSHIYKFKSNGQFIWRFSKSSDDYSATLTDAALSATSLITLSHAFDVNNLYRLVIDKISLESGRIVESSGSLSILPENSYGTTLIPINDNELLFSGITGFRQNKPPAGMSLYDNGKAFISKYSFLDKKLLTSSYRKSLRKDMVTSMTLDNSKLNILIDSDGPLTHSADTDAMQAYQKSSLIEFSDFNTLF